MIDQPYMINKLPQNSHLLKKLIELASSMGQGTEEKTLNLGFGYIYYGLTRIYKPEVVVCIGSYRGFGPICFALGLTDNKKGKCYFIDPGKVDRYWHDPKNIELLRTTFDLQDRWQHLRKTSQQVIAEKCIPSVIDILFIDGDHSFEGVKYDFDHFGSMLSPNGIILLHDSINDGRGFTKWEVKKFIEKEILGRSQYETFTFPFAAGLTLVKKLI